MTLLGSPVLLLQCLSWSLWDLPRRWTALASSNASSGNLSTCPTKTLPSPLSATLHPRLTAAYEAMRGGASSPPNLSKRHHSEVLSLYRSSCCRPARRRAGNSPRLSSAKRGIRYRPPLGHHNWHLWWASSHKCRVAHMAGEVTV